MKSFARDALVSVLVAAVLFAVLHVTVQQFTIQQVSMTPNIVEGERIIVNKLAYLFGGPQRGDIIVFYPPPEVENQELIKRVIGLPGETVEIKSGTVYINGRAIREPYIKDPPRYRLDPYEVPAGQYFVLGDNRNNSNDSHTGWTVVRASITGKAVVSIWPLNAIGLAPNYAYAEK